MISKYRKSLNYCIVNCQKFKNNFCCCCLKNEQPSVKIKWAARLLMKLRKDIQKMSQKDLVDIITNVNGANSFANEPQASNKCVISNPDMKGKMRRIDCLRQSDKVWRLDLVMVVLFKGMPLESSDGERIDKLPECNCPQLCINPNHAMINVRDLEIYLANYISNSNTAQIVNRSTNDGFHNFFTVLFIYHLIQL